MDEQRVPVWSVVVAAAVPSAVALLLWAAVVVLRVRLQWLAEKTRKNRGSDSVRSSKRWQTPRLIEGRSESTMSILYEYYS